MESTPEIKTKLKYVGFLTTYEKNGEYSYQNWKREDWNTIGKRDVTELTEILGQQKVPSPSCQISSFAILDTPDSIVILNKAGMFLLHTKPP